MTNNHANVNNETKLYFRHHSRRGVTTLEVGLSSQSFFRRKMENTKKIVLTEAKIKLSMGFIEDFSSLNCYHPLNILCWPSLVWYPISRSIHFVFTIPISLVGYPISMIISVLGASSQLYFTSRFCQFVYYSFFFILHHLWAADPQEIMSCRTSGVISVHLSVHPSKNHKTCL